MFKLAMVRSINILRVRYPEAKIYSWGTAVEIEAATAVGLVWNSFLTIYRIGILGIASKIVYIRTVSAIVELIGYVVYHIEHKWKVDDRMTNIWYRLSLMDRPELLEGPLAYCGMRKKPGGVLILSRRGGIIYLVQGGTPFSTRQEFLIYLLQKVVHRPT